MASALSKCATHSTSTLYTRDVSRPFEIQMEIHLIYEILSNAFKIAREVTVKTLDGSSDKLVPKKVTFKVTSEFLVFLVAGSTFQGLEGKHLNHVRAFLQKTPPTHPGVENPHLIKDEKLHGAVMVMATPLQIAYRMQDDWFKKIDLPLQIQTVSCFDFVIIKAGFNYLEFLQFLKGSVKGKDISFFDYIHFLESKQWSKATLPFKSQDIVVYYHDNKPLISHAALISENPKKVYAKFGDDTPFAYLHLEKETPLMYGRRFEIYRKK